jgi:rod shape-determining protein MreD
VLGARSMMIGQSPPVLWTWYAAVTGLALGVGVLITVIRTQAAPSPYVLLWQFVATMLLYPFSQRLIDRFEDADVRFR